MNSQTSKIKGIVVVIGGILTFILLLAIVFSAYQLINRKDLKVENFNDCVKATGVVLESYPEQCIYNGKTYVNVL